MKTRVLLCGAALALTIGVPTATAGNSTKVPDPSQELCESNGGTYSTRANTSVFAPGYKKQRVLWTCNGYTGGQPSTDALVNACLFADGGAGFSSFVGDSDPNSATCWKDPFLVTPPSQELCESYGGTYSTDAKTSLFAPGYKKQRVLWTCNGYTGGQPSTDALVNACLFADGGAGFSSFIGGSDPNSATCWKDPFLT